LLSACSGGIIPKGGASSPVDNVPVPDVAAKPVPATPVPPLASCGCSTGEILNCGQRGVVRGPAIGSLSVDPRKTRSRARRFPHLLPGPAQAHGQLGADARQRLAGACDAVKTWTGDAISFFATYMDAVQVGEGKAFVTGYFEPEIAGSRTQQPGYDVAIYKRPADLIDVDLGQFSDDLKGKSIRGKVQGTKFIPYDERAAIVDGSLAGRGLEIAWAADPVEFLLFADPGLGPLRLPDGGVMRIGYESQNGRGYTGIGKLMKDRGLITDGSMQGIVKYLRENPEEGKKIMNENKSFVFFRELTGAGPLGAMGYPVVGEASVAVDPKYVPLGAPVWLSLDRAEPNGVWVAQDTGGAIKGANRFDSFWGAGDRARAIAGGMSARGSALLFLPKAAVARLIPTE
jgi:membrane-bound lytic murein transglycosylase A